MKKHLNKTAVVTGICCYFLPFIPLLHLFFKYNTELIIWQALILAATLGVLVVLVYTLVLRITHAPLSGSLCALFLTLCFFCYDWFRHFALDQRATYDIGLKVLVPIITLVLVFLCVRLAMIGKKLPNECNVLLCMMYVAMLALNLFPAMPFLLQGSIDPTLYKTEFAADEGTPTPNVYWFQPDGMLGFDAMSAYYGEDSAAFKQALKERGFVITEDARLEGGHHTDTAVPVLMSPSYYDLRLRAKLEGDSPLIRNAFRASNSSELFHARVNNEMIAAFQAKGYHTITLGTDVQYFSPSVDKYYLTASHADSGSYRGQNTRALPYIFNGKQDTAKLREYATAVRLANLVCGDLFRPIVEKLFPAENGGQMQPGAAGGESGLAVMLPDAEISRVLGDKVYGIDYYSSFVQSLNDSLEVAASPKMTTVHFTLPHCPFFIEDDEIKLQSDDILSIFNYPSQHAYTGKVLINLIDMVLAKDPSAVIVLQADHGIHYTGAWEQLVTAFGEERALAYWNSVISAVRCGDVPGNANITDPRNISRFLVNTYVGKNYEYIR